MANLCCKSSIRDHYQNWIKTRTWRCSQFHTETWSESSAVTSHGCVGCTCIFTIFPFVCRNALARSIFFDRRKQIKSLSTIAFARTLFFLLFFCSNRFTRNSHNRKKIRYTAESWFRSESIGSSPPPNKNSGSVFQLRSPVWYT